MEKDNKEPVLMFNNGCMYYAHTMTKGSYLKEPQEIGFHTIVFYKQFSGQNVIASIRGPAMGGHLKSHVRKLVNNYFNDEVMENICLEELVSVLRNDISNSWYKDKEFVKGKYHNESIEKYIEKNSDIPISLSTFNHLYLFTK